MQHKIAYEALINKAKMRGLIGGYTELHHIVPRSLGGSDEQSNLVRLTAREHFIAHMLLAKIHGGPMWSAIFLMRGQKQAYFNSRLYEIARKEFIRNEIGTKFSDERKQKISNALKGKALSLETNQKLSQARKGRTISNEWREKLRQASIGYKHSDSAKEKISRQIKSRTLHKMRDWMFNYAI